MRFYFYMDLFWVFEISVRVLKYSYVSPKNWQNLCPQWWSPSTIVTTILLSIDLMLRPCGYHFYQNPTMGLLNSVVVTKALCYCHWKPWIMSQCSVPSTFCLPGVEVDTSTYAIPSKVSVRRWLQAVPAGFIFHFKAFGLFCRSAFSSH